MKLILAFIAACLLSSMNRVTSESSTGALRHSSDQSSRSLEEDDEEGSNGYFACGPKLFCVSNRSKCEDNERCSCLPGFSGPPLCEPEDECKAETYPCAGGDKTRSYCVNMSPPEAYKCLCFDQFDAILPDQADVTDPVPAAWRPLACIEKEAVASAVPQSAPTTKAPVVPTPSPTTPGFCNVAADCAGNNYVCGATSNQCVCPKGFAEVGANCQLENECAPGFPNDCHRYATCSEEPAPFFYSCSCSEGYSDTRPGVDKAGTVCVQDNECQLGTHDCGTNLTCLDRVPPMKWECIEPTPAPTSQPTPSPTAPRPFVAAAAVCTIVPLEPAFEGNVGCSLCPVGQCVTSTDAIVGFGTAGSDYCTAWEVIMAKTTGGAACNSLNSVSIGLLAVLRDSCGCVTP